jgi:hypothetical protein
MNPVVDAFRALSDPESQWRYPIRILGKESPELDVPARLECRICKIWVLWTEAAWMPWPRG